MTTITPGATMPINAGGLYTPGGAVTAPSTAYSGTFIPALWSGRLAQKFYAATVFGEIANTDWQGEIQNLGDTVIINTIPSITITPYSIGTNLAYQVPSPNTVTLQINRGQYFAVVVPSVWELQSKPKLMDMFANDAAMQMKIIIDRDVLTGTYNLGASYNQGATAGKQSAAYNLGTDLAPITLTGANILQYITALSSVLDEANVPESDRFLVISPAERQLLMQSNLAQAQFMGDPQSMVRNGKIGMIDRFVTYVSNLVPRGTAGQTYTNWGPGTTNDATGQSSALTNALKRHAVIAGHKSAITFASQIAKVETLQNPNDFGQLVRGLNIYGYQAVANDYNSTLSSLEVEGLAFLNVAN